MAKIYAVQENNRMDYSPAEDHGELVFLTAQEISPVAASLKNADILDGIRRRLNWFDPEVDMMLFTGSPVTMGFAFHLAYRMAQGAGVPLRYLQWDRFTNSYRVGVFPMTIDESEEMDDDE